MLLLRQSFKRHRFSLDRPPEGSGRQGTGFFNHLEPLVIAKHLLTFDQNG